jgi:hypothetical protein
MARSISRSNTVPLAAANVSRVGARESTGERALDGDVCGLSPRCHRSVTHLSLRVCSSGDGPCYRIREALVGPDRMMP